MRVATAALMAVALAPSAWAGSRGPAAGTLVVDGGAFSKPVRDRFLALAGGANARVVVIPTAASSTRFGPGEEKTILNPDWPPDRPEWGVYQAYLREWLGCEQITIVHTRDRKKADTKEFVAPLDMATGVFIGPGNAGRLAEAYLKTRTQKALEALLARGGVIAGSSAGAIIQGSFIVRGRPDKPLLMPKGRTRGFGFLDDVAINPHLTSAKRDAELVNVVDAHPEVLGIGLDDEAALVVKGDRFEVIGTGRAAIYDNKPHPGAWYYWLSAGDSFDLPSWTKVTGQ